MSLELHDDKEKENTTHNSMVFSSMENNIAG